MPSGRAGPVAWYTPAVRASAMRSIHSARSRASMNCTGASGAPGASTSPPAATRSTQYVNRSL